MASSGSMKKNRHVVILAIATFLFSTITVPSFAEDYSCLQPPDTYGTEPIWTTSDTKDLKFIVSWAFKDPEKCIVGMDYNPIAGNNFTYPKSYNENYQFPTSWSVNRSGEMVLVSAEVEFPLPLLKSLTHLDNSTSEVAFFQTTQKFEVSGYLKIKKTDKYSSLTFSGKLGLAQLWGYWFSKNQEIFPSSCNALDIKYDVKSLNSKVNWKVLESGNNPKIEISITQDSDCIFLVHAAPLESFKTVTGFNCDKLKTLAEYPFWCGQGSAYFSQILEKPDQILQIGLGDFTESKLTSHLAMTNSYYTKVINLPIQSISHKDSIVRSQEVIRITSSLDANSIKNTSVKNVTLYVGFYSWHQYGGLSYASGWRVTWSGNNWTARYSSGGSISGGKYMVYQTQAIVIPVSDLILSETEKAAAELKTKQEAEAKAAADLKAKQEAEAKAAAELKAKQEAAAIAAAPELARLAQQKQYCLQHNIDVQMIIKRITALGKDPYSLGFYIKEEFDCDQFGKPSYWSEAYLFSTKKEVWDNQMSSDLKSLAKYEKEALAVKKTTITCVKGKLTKKVTAVKPKCPSGYKKK